MNDYFVDLHIHIGRTEKGAPVKISGSRDLTFFNIAKEASERKGIEVIGIIDSHSPAVQDEIDAYLDKGEMEELEGGGIRYHRTTVLLGSEIEVKDPGMGAAHLLAYLPTLAEMKKFTGWMKRHMKNVELSSQRLYVPARELQDEVYGRGGLLIPAHIFTPYKSVFGSGTTRLANMLDPDKIAAVELGLSADTEMASCLSELDRYSFVTNSDAHSLGKIGREYNVMKMAAPSFEELRLALARRDGRRVAANYGLNPRLGKYHRTYCDSCESILDETETTIERCLYCGSVKIVRGVMDRIRAIADRETPEVADRHPPYRFQVPLEFIPGLGKKKLAALLERFGTEMNILHRVPAAELAEAAGEDIARYIVQARDGSLSLETGGGGRYGKVSRAPSL
ncbi:endonuclease Q family protein [Paenibacillus flagellatus]|uniref:TIGR00375 family protein n=1 Tax=Paenibacillus flagellatus TaxID=2211139 RepID=A0A2V5K6K5_9BACL|nr:endonuclease Q family protein [Paenibacillus flagellatus]PYI55025.1 TIGR00375 family protein [Paenibacillus flagellatus]